MNRINVPINSQQLIDPGLQMVLVWPNQQHRSCSLCRVNMFRVKHEHLACHRQPPNPDLHAHLSIKQGIKSCFIGGVPYWHIEVLFHPRTNNLVQGQKRKLPDFWLAFACWKRGGHSVSS
jgi:hypothetical protein